MKQAFAILAFALGFTIFAPSAFAGVYNCSTTTNSGEKLGVAVNFTAPTADKPSVYTSTVTLGDDSFSQLGASCFVMDRPSTRYVRCTHQAGKVRIEIYPTVETTSGSLKLMQFIIWDGPQAQRGDFADCTTK